MTPSAPASSTATTAGSGSTRETEPARSPENGGSSAQLPQQSPRGEAPLLCPHCKSNPGGQTGDFGAMEAPCPMPDRPLDAALERRFRSAELRAAVTREFSQELSWGELTEDFGLHPSEEATTTISGELAIDGEIVYRPCHDKVYAPVTIRFATADGKLALNMRGEVGLSRSELGWAEGSAPVFTVFGKDDLSTARGTLDLGFDPNKVQLGELYFSLVGVADSVYGKLRIAMLEFADEATREAALQPSDTPPPRKGWEVTAAQFPHDRCDGQGRPVAHDEALPELGGATAQQLFAASAARLGTAHPIDATWPDGQATRVTFGLGELPAQTACVAISPYDPSSLSVESAVRAHSEDGMMDVTFPRTLVHFAPYTTVAQRLTFHSPGDRLNDDVLPWPVGEVRWQNGANAPSTGSVYLPDDVRMLAWPHCAHTGTCDQ